jgi:hypothetical protein
MSMMGSAGGAKNVSMSGVMQLNLFTSTTKVFSSMSSPHALPDFNSQSKSGIKKLFTSGNPFTSTGFTVANTTTRDFFKDYGTTVKGPVDRLILFHYLFFIFALLLLLFVEVGYTRLEGLETVVFVVTAALALQLARLTHYFFPNSIMTLFLTLVPFVVLIAMLRQGSVFVMVLWGISITSIYLQAGHPDLEQYLYVFSVVFFPCYFGALYLRSALRPILCDDALLCQVPIDYDVEITACISVFILLFNVIILERFIKMNALVLIERENFVRSLYTANMELQRQLRTVKDADKNTFEAPLSQAIQVLKEIKETSDLDEEIMQNLDIIIRILGTDQLFTPSLDQGQVDAEVHGWLNDLLLNRKHSEMSSGRRSVTSMLKKTGLESSGTRTNSTEVTPTPPSMSLADLPPEMTSAVIDYLEDFDQPSFDVIHLNKITGGHALVYAGTYIFKKMRFHETFRISESTLKYLLVELETNYGNGNPYHNHLHAADVAQCTFYFVTRSRVWDMLPDLEALAILLAAIVHDYKHPGFNNPFLITTMHPLAILYNDQSVLENHHCASVFELFQKPEFNILSSLDDQDRRNVRDIMITAVLATDMAFHFEWVAKFKTKMTGAGLDLDKFPDRKLLLTMAVKCSDVNNPCKPLDMSKVWTEMVMEEFFRQGDEEKRLGIPVSVFYDREKTEIAKCQIVS